MTQQASQPTPPEDVLGAATAWFARRRSGTMTQAEAGELEAWLAGDPARREAFALTEHMWGRVGADAVRSHPRVLALRERGLNWRARGGWRRWAGPAIAATLVLAAVAGWSLIGPTPAPSEGPLTPAIQQSFRTTVGQRATVTLPDGSVVTLDTDTILRTRESAARRLVFLDRGQAFFRVAHDRARPFVVAAGGRTVTATGTAFSVRVGQGAGLGAFKVTLVEGKVKVASPLAPVLGIIPSRHVQTTEMEAGSQLVALDNRRWSVSEIDGARETSWLQGRLAYKDRPLGEVVAEMNRYSDKKIVIRDPDVAAKRLSGTYRAGDIDGFVRALQDYGVARVDADGAGGVELTRQ